LTYPKLLSIIRTMSLRCPHCRKELPMALFTAFIGRIGGSQTSKAKKRSSRLNGKLGGRPKEQKEKR